MNLKCLFGRHDWAGCKCSTCSKTRDEGHDWSKDCEKCVVCRNTRPNSHRWQGCKCLMCSKTRDEGHDWSKDCEKCAMCGTTRAKAHQWSGLKCSICGTVDSAKARTALMGAAYKADTEGVSALIIAGTDVNAKDNSGRTLLMEAAEVGSNNCVTALISAGADVEAKDLDGDTPLIRAARNGNVNCVTALVAAGANVKAKDDSGRTALYWADIGGHADCVEALQSIQARTRLDELNRVTNMNLTEFTGSLLDAAKNSDTNHLLALSSLGATLKSENGTTLLTQAVDSLGMIWVCSI